MRRRATTLLLMGALAMPAIGLAATTRGAQTPTSAKAASKSAAAATHATRGVVKSVDDSTLVITRPGKKGGEMTFALNASTHRVGNLAVGAPVSVRYREEGKSYVATAVNGKQAKQASRTTPANR